MAAIRHQCVNNVHFVYHGVNAADKVSSSIFCSESLSSQHERHFETIPEPQSAPLFQTAASCRRFFAT
ncbi:hypothetical protein EYF80_028012 [Liparis tanakae]|uniref:Uncharacterized protein n=1 Tax=Liparis tanakae TaxID=230148 RepID=A0A4Z2H8E3_9TELE|nr:hypothetical protein EYF80_028012 [Liparis tanakae]